MSHHWPDEANANILSDDKYLDPISGFPAFKSQLCQGGIGISFYTVFSDSSKNSFDDHGWEINFC